MAYARRSLSGYGRPVHPPLGSFLSDALSFNVTGLAVDTINAGKSLSSGLSTKTSDAQRQARASFFQNSAIAGSVTAYRYILGGLQNTAGDERPYYSSAQAAVRAQNPEVATEGDEQGQKWAAGIPDPKGTQSMINDVIADLNTIAAAVPVSNLTNFGGAVSTTGTSVTSTPTTGRAVTLPGMTTTAGYNYTPYILAGVGILAVSLLGRKSA